MILMMTYWTKRLMQECSPLIRMYQLGRMICILRILSVGRGAIRSSGEQEGPPTHPFNCTRDYHRPSQIQEPRQDAYTWTCSLVQTQTIQLLPHVIMYMTPQLHQSRVFPELQPSYTSLLHMDVDTTLRVG